MISESLNSYQLTLSYLGRLLADVPDLDIARQPNGVMNHPAWVIGHLAFSCQALGGELGLTTWLPARWIERFGTGSNPTADRTAYPSKADLFASLAGGHERLAERLTWLGESAMAAPLPDERYRSTFPTLGHAVVHVLTGHAAVHVGQVSVWRRIAGYGPLAEIFV